MSRIDLVHSGHSRRPSRGLLSAAVRAAGPWPGCRPGCGPASSTRSETRLRSGCGRGLQRHRVVLGQQLRHHNREPGPPGPVMSAPNPLSNAYSANSIGAKCAFGRLTPGRGLAGRLFPEVSAGRLFPGGAAARESREWPAGSGGKDLGSLIPPSWGQRSKIFWQRPRPDRCVITTATTATSVTTGRWALNTTRSSRVDGAVDRRAQGTAPVR